MQALRCVPAALAAVPLLALHRARGPNREHSFLEVDPEDHRDNLVELGDNLFLGSAGLEGKDSLGRSVTIAVPS